VAASGYGRNGRRGDHRPGGGTPGACFLALAAGLVLAALGAAVLTQIESPSGLGVLTAGSLLIGVGAGSVGTLATDAVVAAAPPERAGAASAISETGAEIGGALGIAVLGSIGAAVYRNAIAIPQGVPPEDAAVARDTLGGAVETGKDPAPPRLRRTCSTPPAPPSSTDSRSPLGSRPLWWPR
jgi:MFS family permease